MTLMHGDHYTWASGFFIYLISQWNKLQFYLVNFYSLVMLLWCTSAPLGFSWIWMYEIIWFL